MAGAGVRVFSSGEILTAAQVNQYFMDQVVARFADAATRDASFGGAGQPTLTEGRLCYLDSTNAVQIYDGSSWNDASQFTVGDGTITNAKLANNSVTSDKIAPGTVIAADIAAGTVTATELADGAVTSGKILDGTIVNGDINASAAIALSKLASGTSAQVVLANSSGVPTYTTLSGDVTISNTGVTTIQPNSVALGTDTTGNYVSDIVAGTGLAVTHTPGEGSSATIALAGLSFTTSSVAYTLQASDNNNLVEITATSAVDVTVPPSASVAWPNGTQITIFQRGTGKVRVLAGSGVTILSTPGVYLRGQYSGATLVRRDTNVWFLFGDLSST